MNWSGADMAKLICLLVLAVVVAVASVVGLVMLVMAYPSTLHWVGYPATFAGGVVPAALGETGKGCDVIAWLLVAAFAGLAGWLALKWNECWVKHEVGGEYRPHLWRAHKVAAWLKARLPGWWERKFVRFIVAALIIVSLALLGSAMAQVAPVAALLAAEAKAQAAPWTEQDTEFIIQYGTRLLLALSALVAGGAWWMSKLHSKVNYIRRDLDKHVDHDDDMFDEIKEEIRRIFEKLEEMTNAISVMSTKIDAIEKRMERK